MAETETGPAGTNRSETPLCPNCGTYRLGPYCHECGQRRIVPEERRIGHFLSEFANALFFLDGRLPRTLNLLIFRPGRLARRYLDGQRRQYLSPLAMFLICNIVFFLSPPLTDLTLPLSDHLNYQVYSGLAERLVDARLEAREIGLREYAESFSAQQMGIAKLLVIIHWPLVALALMGLHQRRDLFYVDHLEISLYLGAFLILQFTIVPYLYQGIEAAARLVAVNSGALGDALSVAMKSALLVVMVLWIAFFIHGGYRQSWWRAALKTPVVVAVFAVSHLVVYRTTDFLIVFALT